MNDKLKFESINISEKTKECISEFHTVTKSQVLIDKLQAGTDSKSAGIPLLLQLLYNPGAPLSNWMEILDEISNEFKRDTTTNYRVALLQLLKTIDNIAETTIPPNKKEAFRDSRHKCYKTFLVQESLVGENICIETLLAVTQREIAAGRLSPNDNLCNIVKIGMNEPHLSRDELKVRATTQTVTCLRRAITWLFSKFT